ncbi:DUF4331 family protein [Actinophytocola xanthii]|uniref:DUF4331 domain-containing protein n=1 Tax=Actinophytocola xanthii TaxID=1912961 RepID=A0A1Q8CXT3_9PSEU|nr:DUF4331 family protein [Actinophytocola xanthii]OLF19178.1 hypothetical protein BU204_02105 [Actinophytocola xanthii]
MSHHLGSPAARRDLRLDISDVYVFPGAAGTVFVMNVNPLSGRGGFHPRALYEFKVDTDGDAREDLTFRVTFGAAYPNGAQRVELRQLSGPAARNRDAEGRIVAQGMTGAECSGTGGIRLWSGPAADPFIVNGVVLGAVCTALASGTPVDLSGFDPTGASNAFGGTNVSAIVLEVPDGVLGAKGIGFWGVTALATDAGGWRQVSRCAQPLVNTLLHPVGPELPDDYDASEPHEDLQRYGRRLTELVTRVVAATRTASDPVAHARRVRDALLPDILPYRLGTAAAFGFTQRNGRGLGERSPEVICSLVLNTAITHGLGSDAAAGAPRAEFPYLPLPVPGGSSS